MIENEFSLLRPRVWDNDEGAPHCHMGGIGYKGELKSIDLIVMIMVHGEQWPVAPT